MSPSIESPEVTLELPKPHVWMSSSSKAERYTAPNNGDIEIENDPMDVDEEELTPEQEQSFEEVISTLKGGVEKSFSASSSSSSNASSSPVQQTRQKEKYKPPVLPSAPIDPLVPASLARRQKGLHHAAGWHHRTRMESEAAETLMARLKYRKEDVMPVVTKFVGEASQKTLRLVAEEHRETIDKSVKAIREQIPESCQIIETSVEASSNGTPLDSAVDLEKIDDELASMPVTQQAREQLISLKAYVDSLFVLPRAL